MCLQDVSQIGMGLKRYKIKLDHNSKIKNLNQRFVLWGKNQWFNDIYHLNYTTKWSQWYKEINFINNTNKTID